MLIDTHCHINSLKPQEREAFLSGLDPDWRFIDVSIDIPSTRASLELSGAYPFIYSCIGFHPFSIESFTDDTLAEYEEILRSTPNIVGVGEIGLDFTAKFSTHDQVRILHEFINLAKKFSKPVAIHNRFNLPMIFDILDEHYPDYSRVVFHCFSQDERFLRRVLDKGGIASFSLNILRKKREILDALKNIPLESLMLETDSPYMYVRNQRSSPRDIETVYDFVAGHKQIDRAELQQRVYENAAAMFGFAQDKKGS